MEELPFDDVARFAPDGLSDDLERADRMAASFGLPSSGPSRFTVSFAVRRPRHMGRLYLHSHPRTSGLAWLLALPDSERSPAAMPDHTRLSTPPGWPEEVLLPVEQLGSQLYPLMYELGRGIGKRSMRIRDPLHGTVIEFSTVVPLLAYRWPKLRSLAIRPLGIEGAAQILLPWQEAWHLFLFLPQRQEEDRPLLPDRRDLFESFHRTV